MLEMAGWLWGIDSNKSFWLSKWICTVALRGQMHCNLHCENAAKVLRMELLVLWE